MDDAIPVASASASSLVWGFSFQFPEMSGFLAYNLIVEWRLLLVGGAKAVAEHTRREARGSFIVAVMKTHVGKVNLAG